MTTKALTVLTLAVPLLVAQAQPSQPAVAAAPPPPPLSPLEQQIADIKHPVSWMTWGGDMRIRDEYFDNILTLNPNNPLHLQDYIRFRGRVWTSVTPVNDISFNLRLTDEVREWLRPAGYTAFRYTEGSGLDWREGLFDNINVQWRNMFGLPLTATVGRQDFLPGTPSGLGDGWLVGDGTPQDGSWTYFLDAARVKYEFKEQHTSIEAIGIIQDAKDDGWMPTINNQDLYLADQNEKGAILWVANTSMPEANLDGYFIYKRDDRITRFGPPVVPPPTGDNADIYTFGARVSGTVAKNWKYSAEGAYQFGQKQDPTINNALLDPSARTTGYRDIRAFGWNTKLTYLVKDKLNNQIGFAYEFLSGDDPSTKNDEMFDNLWGRWPRWSEIGLYSFAAETRIGNEANLHRFGPTWSITPAKGLEFNAAYYALFAQEEVATRGPTSLFSGNGTFRGHFLQAILKYRISKHMVAHLWSEFQFPGDYYVHDATWYFLRPEVMFTF